MAQTRLSVQTFQVKESVCTDPVYRSPLKLARTITSGTDRRGRILSVINFS